MTCIMFTTHHLVSLLLLLLSGVLVLTTTVAPTDVPNQCPQELIPYLTFYGHPDNCRDYFMCSHGQPIPQQCPEGLSWSDVHRTCVWYNSHFDTCLRENARRECGRGYTGLIPHPTECQRYHNCSDPRIPWIPYELKQFDFECPYPQLFDIVEKTCKPYDEANCGFGRKAPTDYCDYWINKCRKSHCVPCSSRSWYFNCTGLADGYYHKDPSNEGSLTGTAFIECKDQRSIARIGCQDAMPPEQCRQSGGYSLVTSEIDDRLYYPEGYPEEYLPPHY